MAFIVNLTGVPQTGTYTEGFPSGIRNNHGILSGVLPASGIPHIAPPTGEASGINPSGYPFSGTLPDYSPTMLTGTDAASNSANSVETSIEVVRELTYKQSVKDGEWNIFSGKFETPLKTEESGCWNMSTRAEASPYIETLNVDNAIQADNIMTFANGGETLAFTLNRVEPDCECPPHIPHPIPYWGPAQYEIEPGDGDCQGVRTWKNKNKRIFYFSGVHAGLTGLFAMSPYAEWINDLDQLVLDDRTCLDNLIEDIGATCTHRHNDISYVGTGISDVGVSGVNWTGWCANSQYQFENTFFETRTDCTDKPGYLYACNSPLSSELIPTDHPYGLQDSCDCLAAYNNGRWSSTFFIDDPVWDRVGKDSWPVPNAKPDWDASNEGTGPGGVLTPLWGPCAHVYYTGEGCFRIDPNGDIEYPPADFGRPGPNESPLFVIVATGGGGPGSGDNIPPYWSDTECDWMYAIREISSATCAETCPPTCPPTTGCPSGPIITVGLSKLWRQEIVFPYGCVDWSCCVSGATCSVGSSLFDVGDYVNIASYQLSGYYKSAGAFDNGFAIDLSLSGAGALFRGSSRSRLLWN